MQVKSESIFQILPNRLTQKRIKINKRTISKLEQSVSASIWAKPIIWRDTVR